MLEFAMIEPGGILRVRPSGALTSEDFSGLTRFADAYLERHGNLGGLLIEARSFPGWDSFAGFAAHVRFIRDHERHVERIALVTDSAIAPLAEKLADPFIAADIRCFAFNEFDTALHWLRTDGRTAANLLVVLTSHGQLGSTGRKTGFWLEELAAPYYVFTDAGAKVTLASPKGGQPPLDPASDDPQSSSDATRRFKSDVSAQAALANTRRLHDVSAADFDAVFYPGRPRAVVGPGRGSRVDCSDSGHVRGGQAARCGMPRARGPPAREIGDRRAIGERPGGDGFFQLGGARGRSQRRRALPG